MCIIYTTDCKFVVISCALLQIEKIPLTKGLKRSILNKLTREGTAKCKEFRKFLKSFEKHLTKQNAYDIIDKRSSENSTES